MKIIFRVLLLLSIIPNLAQAETTKEWTFLVFINGNNNLDFYGALNINQMEKVGSDENRNIVVQWASLGNKKTGRYYIQKDDDANTVTSPLVEDLGNVDMGDYRTLESFLRWGMEKYPAKHYFLTVWDHGSGWRFTPDKAKQALHINDISYDDNTGHAITTKELGQVINSVSRSTGRKIDIYGSDACLMAMVEIAGEMSQSIDFFVGSQHLEPMAGWPYTEILTRLSANPTMSPRELSSVVTEEYFKSYQGGSNGTDEITFSAFDMSKYEMFKNNLKNLGQEISQLATKEKEQIANAAREVLSFTYSDYGDYGDFLQLLKKGALKSTTIDAASSSLKEFAFISKASGQFGKAQGLSFWLPKTSSDLNMYSAKYHELAFDASTGWSNALATFIK